MTQRTRIWILSKAASGCAWPLHPAATLTRPRTPPGRSHAQSWLRPGCQSEIGKKSEIRISFRISDLLTVLFLLEDEQELLGAFLGLDFFGTHFFTWFREAELQGFVIQFIDAQLLLALGFARKDVQIDRGRLLACQACLGDRLFSKPHCQPGT